MFWGIRMARLSDVDYSREISQPSPFYVLPVTPKREMYTRSAVFGGLGEKIAIVERNQTIAAISVGTSLRASFLWHQIQASVEIQSKSVLKQSWDHF